MNSDFHVVLLLLIFCARAMDVGDCFRRSFPKLLLPHLDTAQGNRTSVNPLRWRDKGNVFAILRSTFATHPLEHETGGKCWNSPRRKFFRCRPSLGPQSQLAVFQLQREHFASAGFCLFIGRPRHRIAMPGQSSRLLLAVTF